MTNGSLTPLWTSAAIASAVGGAASAAFSVDGVTFDSRDVRPGDLFVALRGETLDGHAFVPDAVRRGATGCLVERGVDAAHVRVADSLAALERLAAAARTRASAATVIGVTGSVGKTSVKEALRRAFQRTHAEASHWSVKSYNNHTGVPLSLARMPADARWAVFELGMNHAGEISVLTRQVRPHVGLITWVAPAHIENFADGEAGIARAKAEIFEGLEPGGCAVIPADNRHAPVLAGRARELGAQILTFGRSADADVRLLAARPAHLGPELCVDVAGDELRFTLGLEGAHWVSNALAVLATVCAAKGDVAEAALALSDMAPLAGRGALLRVPVSGGTAVILDESYNANPASMAAALAVLGARPERRRLAVLGAMKELGAHSAALHAGLAGPIAEADVSELALVGPEMDALAAPAAERLADAEQAAAWVRAKLRPGDVLLVKGSNSVGLAAVVNALAGAEEPAA
ncbi:MAG: UDP-N-acetylmuramoyl-tripeptide--D-alanyl-D-alanine ligase [Thermaurantiacus sp.]